MRAANFEKKPSPSHGKKKRINDIRASIGKHDPGNTRFRYTGERDGGGRNREVRGRKRGGYTRGRKEKRGGRGKRSVGREAPRLVGPPPL